MSERITWVERQDGWRAIVLCFASGALLTFGFAPYHIWPVIFVGLPVFFLSLLASMNRRHAGLRALAFGYGFFMAGTWWISNAMRVDMAKFGWMIPFSILGLSGVLALYFLIFGLVMYSLRRTCHVTNILRFTVLWVAVEYLRSVGLFGFPWNLMGYISLSSLPVAQLAYVSGTFGLSLLVVLAGLLPVLVFKETAKVKRIAGVAVPLVMIAGLYVAGTERLKATVWLTDAHLRIVQPNIPQTIKNSEEGRALALKVLGEFSTAYSFPMPTAVLWSEAALPGEFNESRSSAIFLPQGTLITGAVRTEGQTDATFQIFNSIAAIDNRGQVVASYDKSQLVPFGEFVPLRSVLPLEKITPGSLDFSRGHGPTTLDVAGAPPFSPLVCYEVVFPWLAVDSTYRPGWLFNATNDGWYGDAPGPYQHFDMARMRAIEQGLPLVRAANSGISGMVDPYGRAVATLPLGVRGMLNTPLPKPLAPGFYAKHGESIILFSLVLLWILTYLPIRSTKPAKKL